MLFLRSADYDASNQVLTVRLRSPSGTSWAAYEYRDVHPGLYDRLLSAQPHGEHVLGNEIAPFHDVRRVGQGTWLPPRPAPRQSTDGLS